MPAKSAKGFTPWSGALPLVPADAEIHEFKEQDLGRENIPTYNKIKSTFKADLASKDQRFNLSELVAGQLSVEAEEQKRFDRKVAAEVEARVKIIKTEAFDKAHAEGYETGRKEALEGEKARLAGLMEKMATAVTALATAKSSLGEQYEKQLLDVAFKLARVIVHHEVQERPQVMQHTIKAILETIAQEDDVRVRLAIHDFEAIDEIKTDVAKLSHQGRVNFEMDPGLKPGDCVVESASGEVFSIIDQKFEKLRAELDKPRDQARDEKGTGT